MQNNIYLKKISKFSVFFVVNILLLFIISLSTIYSATITKSEPFFVKEIIWFVISIFVFVGVSLIDYRKYYKYSTAIKKNVGNICKKLINIALKPVYLSE